MFDINMEDASPISQRSVFKRHFCTLAEEIEARLILPYLEDVIDTYEADRIYAENTSFKQNEILLTTVLKHGPNGLAYFMKALDVCYPKLSSQIRQKMCESGCSSRSRKIVSDHQVNGKGSRVDWNAMLSGSKRLKPVDQPCLSRKNYNYHMRKDLLERQIEKKILAKNLTRLYGMDTEKIIPLCNSLNDKYNMEEINAQRTNYQRVEKLLDILLKLGPHAFEEFVNAISVVDPDLSTPIIEELRQYNLIVVK